MPRKAKTQKRIRRKAKRTPKRSRRKNKKQSGGEGENNPSKVEQPEQSLEQQSVPDPTTLEQTPEQKQEEEQVQDPTVLEQAPEQQSNSNDKPQQEQELEQSPEQSPEGNQSLEQQENAPKLEVENEIPLAGENKTSEEQPNLGVDKLAGNELSGNELTGNEVGINGLGSEANEFGSQNEFNSLGLDGENKVEENTALKNHELEGSYDYPDKEEEAKESIAEKKERSAHQGLFISRAQVNADKETEIERKKDKESKGIYPSPGFTDYKGLPTDDVAPKLLVQGIYPSYLFSSTQMEGSFNIENKELENEGIDLANNLLNEESTI